MSIFTGAVMHVPWSKRLSFIIYGQILRRKLLLKFFHWHEALRAEKRKLLVATVENLTFMLAQHLTAVKYVSFFWPITKGDRIYDLLAGPGGSVLRYSEINYYLWGGGVVEWFRVLDLKSGGPWLKSSTLPLSGFVLGSPEFNSSTALCK